jgi:hypothetical protein
MRDELLHAIHDKLNLHSSTMLFSVIFLHESEMAFEGEQKKSDEKWKKSDGKMQNGKR